MTVKLPQRDLGTRIIGYDARYPINTHQNYLRQKSSNGIQRSISLRQWPSLLQELNNSPGEQSRSYELLQQSFHFEGFRLFENLEKLLEITDGMNCEIIAVSLFESQLEISDHWLDAILSEKVEPRVAAPDWTFLGLDIANSGFESVLFDFEMNEPVLPHNLISTSPAAKLALDFAQTQLASDGPYYAFGLWSPR